MPEGPSIVILKEEAARFRRKRVLEVSGNTKTDKERLKGKTVVDFKSWGKHFLICFNDFYVRIHLMMFGSYRINERRDISPRLSLRFTNGELNFYNCSVKLIEGNPNDQYDWEKDIMSDTWNGKKAKKAMKQLEDTQICDALLDQEIFGGVGNIIKNEVLFNTKVHPSSLVEALPPRKLSQVIKNARDYSLDFYKWKKKFVLRKHWLVYKKAVCPRCGTKITMQYMGERQRLSFFCSNCQLLFKK
jgi:endonuclease-8